MKKILITNDDGVFSNGIERLARAATAFGEVWVVAPESERSAMSHCITIRQSIEVKPVEFPVPGVHAYACKGTPADCVRIGALNIVPGGPDIVFSGVNYGYNVGMDLQYSATAGSAFEASFQKFQAVAFSEDASPVHEVTDRYLSDIIAELTDRPLPRGKIWNVNFPGCAMEDFKGIARERTVSPEGFYRDRYVEETDLGNGAAAYRIHGLPGEKPTEGSDLEAVLTNYISIGIVSNIS